MGKKPQSLKQLIQQREIQLINKVIKKPLLVLLLQRELLALRSLQQLTHVKDYLKHQVKKIIYLNNHHLQKLNKVQKSQRELILVLLKRSCSILNLQLLVLLKDHQLVLKKHQRKLARKLNQRLQHLLLKMNNLLLLNNSLLRHHKNKSKIPNNKVSLNKSNKDFRLILILVFQNYKKVVLRMF